MILKPRTHENQNGWFTNESRYMPDEPHLKTMPCWVWPQVCQRKERSCQDVIIPPHPTPPHPRRIWRRCHVECGHKCVKGRNAAARTLLSHPTPPHPPASGDDAMLSVAASVSEEETQLPGRYYPTPPHPTPRIWRRCHVECGRKCARGRNAAARTLLSHTPPHLETMLCWLWPQLWRGCWFLSHADGGWGMAFFWLRNPLVLVAESPFFGCGIVFFWLRNRLFLVAESVLFWLRKRLFLVAEACLILVAESPKFGCGSVEIWFRNRTLSINGRLILVIKSTIYDLSFDVSMSTINHRIHLQFIDK